MTAVNPVSRATRGVGPSVVTVVVVEVDEPNGQATCNEVNQAIPITVYINPQRAKGAAPKVGETWLINREFGRWSFAAVLAWQRPVVTGSRTDMGPTLIMSLLAALTDLGLITDETTP